MYLYLYIYLAGTRTSARFAIRFASRCEFALRFSWSLCQWNSEMPPCLVYLWQCGKHSAKLLLRAMLRCTTATQQHQQQQRRRIGFNFSKKWKEFFKHLCILLLTAVVLLFLLFTARCNLTFAFRGNTSKDLNWAEPSQTKWAAWPVKLARKSPGWLMVKMSGKQNKAFHLANSGWQSKGKKCPTQSPNKPQIVAANVVAIVRPCVCLCVLYNALESCTWTCTCRSVAPPQKHHHHHHYHHHRIVALWPYSVCSTTSKVKAAITTTTWEPQETRLNLRQSETVATATASAP